MKTLEEKRQTYHNLYKKLITTDKEDEEYDKLCDDIELYYYMKSKGDFEK